MTSRWNFAQQRNEMIIKGSPGSDEGWKERSGWEVLSERHRSYTPDTTSPLSLERNSLVSPFGNRDAFLGLLIEWSFEPCGEEHTTCRVDLDADDASACPHFATPLVAPISYPSRAMRKRWNSPASFVTLDVTDHDITPPLLPKKPRSLTL